MLSILSSVVETVVRLKSEGHRVVLVSSGAIGVGLKRMDIGSKPKSLAKKQVRYIIVYKFYNASDADVKALAAIGQGRLIALWDNLFGQLAQPIAQILLTRGDIADVRRATSWAFCSFSSLTLRGRVI